MIFQFGDITFTRLDGPSGMSIRGSMNYQQMERLKGKPVPQRIGTPLRVMQMTVELRYQVASVSEMITRLWAKMYSGIEEELIDGNGFSYGTFLIDDIDQQNENLDDKGAVLSATLELRFLEYAVYDQAADDKQKARKNARATIEAKPIEVKPRTLTVTPQGLTTLKISQSVATSRQALSSVKKADQIPAMSAKYLREAKRQLDTSLKAVQEARAEVNNVTAVVSNMQQLKSTLDATVAVTEQMLNSVNGAELADLPGLINGTGATLESQLKNLTSAAAIITAVTSIRQ